MANFDAYADSYEEAVACASSESAFCSSFPGC